MIYIISDTHFCHENIIKYCERPFECADEMDAAIKKKWRRNVSQDDTVIHLGDVGLTSPYALKDIITSLPGMKILILGNHDRAAKAMMEFGFHLALDEMDLKWEGFKIHMQHIPPTRKGNWDVCFHGHIHQNVDPNKWNVNCCVEHNNYMPQPISAMIKKYKTQR
jgi:calcineurin-like phosphoesterase family protein